MLFKRLNLIRPYSHSLPHKVNQLHLEDQCRIRRDHAWHSARSVSVVGRACEHCFLALLELRDALVPALYNLTDADDEVERLASVVARVELPAVEQLANVVDEHSRARVDWGAFTLSRDLYLQSAFLLLLLHVGELLVGAVVYRGVLVTHDPQSCVHNACCDAPLA